MTLESVVKVLKSRENSCLFIFLGSYDRIQGSFDQTQGSFVFTHTDTHIQKTVFCLICCLHLLYGYLSCVCFWFEFVMNL